MQKRKFREDLAMKKNISKHSKEKTTKTFKNKQIEKIKAIKKNTLKIKKKLMKAERKK